MTFLPPPPPKKKKILPAGVCCAGALDAGGFCCASGRLDACGVCDGDAGSCALRITVRVALNASARAGPPGAPPQQAPGGPGQLGSSDAGGPVPRSAGAASSADSPDALFVNGVTSLRVEPV